MSTSRSPERGRFRRFTGLGRVEDTEDALVDLGREVVQRIDQFVPLGSSPHGGETGLGPAIGQPLQN
ncbi:MAG: hypothetical protein ABL931_10905 [Usitatibacteraceae bacterium]